MEKLIFNLTVLELENLIKKCISSELSKQTPQETLSKITSDPQPFIYGINGLAEFLQVSSPTAQKIKNSGRIPFSQAERTIIFRKADILEALSNKKRGGKNG